MRRSWLRLFWLTVVLAGAIAGYLVSAGLGTRLLEEEIELQLSRLLATPVEVGEVEVRFEKGLRVEARDFVAPNPAEAAAPPILSARRIVAWVDLVRLLVGRLELSTLVLEGPQIRLVRNPDGSFVGLPLAPVSSYPDEGLDDRDGLEGFLASVAALDGLADRAAERFRAADRIEVLDGTIVWTERASDSAPGSDPAGEPAIRKLELVNGLATREWLSEVIDMQWQGVFIDGVHSPFAIELGIRRPERGHFNWQLGLEEVPLGFASMSAALAPLTAAAEGVDDMDGSLDLVCNLRTEKDGLHRLDIVGQIHDATLRLRKSGSTFEPSRIDLDASFEIDPLELRILTGRLDAKRLNIEITGAIERPIRDRSPTRISSRTRGIQLSDIRDIALSIEDESPRAYTLARLTERVESGQIRYIEASGSAPLSRWREFVRGNVTDIPEDFLLGGAFDQLTVASGPGDRIEEMQADVEWIGDRLSVRNGRAQFRGRPLPRLDLEINGVSKLVAASDEARQITTSPPPLPGLVPLGRIIEPVDPTALPPVSRIALDIHALDHPLFRWPLRDLRVIVEPLRRGVELHVERGLWAGAAVSGDVVWFDDPEAPTVKGTLNVAHAPEADPEGDPAPAALLATEAVPERWAVGRFEMDFRPRPWLPFSRARGPITLDGTLIRSSDVSISLAPEGTIAARLALDVESPDAVGFDTSFASTGGTIEDISGFVHLPEDLATGSLRATGSLEGPVRDRNHFIQELEGSVRVEARDGQINTRLPLMFRLAEATEGYNPFAKENRLVFETLSMTVGFSEGRLSSEDFEIEGPLRVFARAVIDTEAKPTSIDGVVGIFLFRGPNQMLGNLPLVGAFLPGSDRGLIGAYFEMDGPLASPEVESLPLQTMMSAVPDAIKAPFKVLRLLFDRPEEDS